MRKFSDKTKRIINERTAEGLREAALLWFVFSALDALISRRLTVLWGTTNTLGSFVVWLIAIYIEISRRPI